mmetsp:Transcript_2248/g.14915  ORF Transcript_2248/g.14915 Transcript_2248/m.14915 type:complete len:87 (-) Transcript_2248:397-657(-)
MESGPSLLQVQKRMVRSIYKVEMSKTTCSAFSLVFRHMISPSACEMFELIGGALSPCCVLSGKQGTSGCKEPVLWRNGAALYMHLS